MKYIEAKKLKSEIDKFINAIKRNTNPDPLGTIDECIAAAEIEALNLVKKIIN